ncbi:MAG: hypothetical protein JOZ39_03800 [Chloroflexi bacterium]|nr:hypothetical protein [Chloroflexota bacterium]
MRVFPNQGKVDDAFLQSLWQLVAAHPAADLRLADDKVAIRGLSPEEQLVAVQAFQLATGNGGSCVRTPVSCSHCHLGQRDPLPLTLEVKDRLLGRPSPDKLVPIVEGCLYGCVNGALGDIGLRAVRRGYYVTVGGYCGPRSRLGDLLFDEIVPEELVPELCDAIVCCYVEAGRAGERLGETIDRVGLVGFKEAVLLRLSAGWSSALIAAANPLRTIPNSGSQAGAKP